jgi:hypothetical protein
VNANCLDRYFSFSTPSSWESRLSVKAHIRLIAQPITVQPKNKLQKKIAAEL